MTVETKELETYGMVSVPGYTGSRFLGKRLGKVVGDPATVELAQFLALRMTTKLKPKPKEDYEW